ncbi:MAG: InlB B-repeat-containing protein [Acholeplasmataceae bacterium]
MRKLFLWIVMMSFVFLVVGCQPGENVTLNFETNGGNPIDSMIVSVSDSNLEIPNAEREGYTFDGWYLDEDFTTPFTLLSLVQAGEEITLYAKWIEDSVTPTPTPVVYFTVTFNSNGGTEIQDQVKVSGELATEPPTPTKANYDFGGWFVDSALSIPFDFSTPITNDLTLYAKWTPIQLTVVFYDEDGTLLKTESVAYGEDATPPEAPTKAETAQFYFTFNGWDKPYTNITSNTDIYATYAEELRAYTITFYDEDGTTVLKTETVYYGEDATPPVDPTKAEDQQYTYDFLGWDTSYIAITGDLEIKAVYTETLKTFTVTFLDDQGVILKTETVGYGLDATPPEAPTKAPTNTTTYVFDGWSESYENITEDTEIIAVYIITIRYYPVTYIYILDGVPTTEVNATTYTYDQTDIDQFTPDDVLGYIFDGWYIDDLYQTPYMGEPLKSDVTLYGRYIDVTSDVTPILFIHETGAAFDDLAGGIIYYISEDLSAFFMQDETGHILVFADVTGLSVGDLITFDATASVLENHTVIVLHAVGAITILDSNQDLQAPLELSLMDIMSLDLNDWRNFGRDIITSGVLEMYSDGDDVYYIADMLTGIELTISPDSYASDTIFIDFIGSRVAIGGLLIALPLYDDIEFFYHDYHQAIVEVIISDQELLDELIALAYMFLDQSVFYSGQVLDPLYFQLPPEYPVVLSFETFGENATLFSFDTLTFAEVTEEKVIDIRITATINDLTEHIEIQFVLKPIVILTVAEFLAADNMTYYMVSGVLLHQASYHDEPSIVADETGMMIVMGHVDAEIGDLITIQGLRVEAEGMIFMTGAPELEVIEITSHLQPNPLIATPLSFTEYHALDPSSFNGSMYVEMTGTITFNEMFMEFPMLIDGDHHVMIFPLGDTYHTLKAAEGLNVTVKGFLFASFDDGHFNPFMIFVGFPGDFDLVEMTDQALIDYLTTYITELNDDILYELKYLNLGQHPLIDVLITWTPTGATHTYYDSETYQINALTEPVTLTFDVSFDVGLVTTTLQLEFEAYPKGTYVPYVKINKIHEESHIDNIMTGGTIYYILPNEGFFMFDDTGMIYVYYDQTDTLSIGDEVQFTGYVVDIGFGWTKTLNVYDGFETLDTLKPIPTADIYTLGDVMYLNFFQWQNYGKDVILTGFLIEEYGQLYLHDPFEDAYIHIDPTSYNYDLSIFDGLIGKRIKMGAILLGYGDYGLSYILFNDYHLAPELYMSTDQDLFDLLSQAAQTYLDQMVFISGQTADASLFMAPPIFDAVIIWETFGPNAALFSFDTYTFAEVTEEKVIDIRITVTIGSVTGDIEIQFILKPIEITTVADFYDGLSGVNYIISGVVLFKGDTEDAPTIVADTTGALMIMGEIAAEVGDHIVISGVKHQMDHLVFLTGMPDLYLIEIIDSDNANPLTATPMTFGEINLLDPNTHVGLPYIEISGLLTTHEFFKEGAILVDGDDALIVFPVDEDIYQFLMSAVGLNVTLKGFLFPALGDDVPFDFYLVFINYENDITAGMNTDAALIDATHSYIETLNSDDLFAGDFLNLPTMHAFLGIELSWDPSLETADLIDSLTGEILPLTEPKLLSFTVSFTVGSQTEDVIVEYMAYPEGYVIPPFDAGYMGAIPTLEHTQVEGLFGGFYVYHIQSRYRMGDNEIVPTAEMWFPFPSEQNADYYTIEYRTSVDDPWSTYISYNEIFTTTADNFSFNFFIPTYVRLRAHGDDITDLVSNEVFLEPTDVPTQFIGWFLDESMFISDVMSPFVGRGLLIEPPTVWNLETSENVYGFVTYQWYRINPYTFETTLIVGETFDTYITGPEDIGYLTMVRITGDEINVGGYLQIISYTETKVPVKHYISEQTETGFTIVFSHLMTLEAVESLMISNGFDTLIPTSITQGDDQSTYHVTVDLSTTTELYIYGEGSSWVLYDLDHYYDHMH